MYKGTQRKSCQKLTIFPLEREEKWIFPLWILGELNWITSLLSLKAEISIFKFLLLFMKATHFIQQNETQSLCYQWNTLWWSWMTFPFNFEQFSITSNFYLQILNEIANIHFNKDKDFLEFPSRIWTGPYLNVTQGSCYPMNLSAMGIVIHIISVNFQKSGRRRKTQNEQIPYLRDFRNEAGEKNFPPYYMVRNVKWEAWGSGTNTNCV